MKLSEVIDAIKAFFLDFLGYFLPGAYAILLLSYIIDSKLQFDSKAIVFLKGNENLVLLLFSYIVGYVVYSIGLTETLTSLLPTVKTTNEILDEIKNSPEYESSLLVFEELFIDKQGNSAIDTPRLNVLGVRSIVMSYSPESDVKIYTFMFRSELCRTVGTFSVICGCMGAISSSVHLIYHSWTLFNTGTNYLITYGILIVAGFLLVKTRSRFLSIAYKIPFSIFLAKYYKIA